ncbi:hypothetical protein [Arthrobacter sp. Soil762]|uniref:hypothetical protein n=1 Tax=Arthrobacter sp. Soil762 TaxID=1736401 RepID=UPI00070097B8|nr:hypothetical protein [Arthrobacter sp. Soil762]KRE78899.1 hypothetical protein ASG77_17725 [Arthrobacter sp. Soil762]
MAEVTPSGGAGPIQLSRPADDGGMEVRGGIGGITFQLEELMGGAEKLDDLADELTAVETEVQRIHDGIRMSQTDAWSVGTEAEISLGEAQRSVQAVRAELQGISSQVRASKQDYEAAEVLTNFFADMGIPSLKDFEHVRMDVAGMLPDLRGTDLMLRNAARARHDILSLAESLVPALKPRPVAVERLETLPIEFDGSLASLLERVRIIDERGRGYIEVLETDSGGQKAYVVVIPGTQTGGEMGGTNPFDEAGIVEGVGHGSADVNAAVLEALRGVGAEKGAPVVAVGYSQGGIHAMNLAADEFFLNEYDLKYVLTAGSPVGSIVPTADVDALHLEHRQDWVPGTDGTANPDTRNRVTVTLIDQVDTPEGRDFGLGPGHQITHYQEAARQVAASDDPSLMASTAVLGGVLGAGGTATATRFALSRSKRPTPQPPPRPSEIDRTR